MTIVFGILSSTCQNVEVMGTYNVPTPLPAQFPPLPAFTCTYNSAEWFLDQVTACMAVACNPVLIDLVICSHTVAVLPEEKLGILWCTCV